MFNVLINGEIRAMAWSARDAEQIAQKFREQVAILAAIGEKCEITVRPA